MNDNRQQFLTACAECTHCRKGFFAGRKNSAKATCVGFKNILPNKETMTCAQAFTDRNELATKARIHLLNNGGQIGGNLAASLMAQMHDPVEKCERFRQKQPKSLFAKMFG